jgi:hypothetical protein
MPCRSARTDLIYDDNISPSSQMSAAPGPHWRGADGAPGVIPQLHHPTATCGITLFRVMRIGGEPVLLSCTDQFEDLNVNVR